MTGFRCRSCGKTFPMYATREEEKTRPGFSRMVMHTPCCPHCESIDIAVEVKHFNTS